ncbi:MAG: membrane protein insertase YidC [Acidimicrobiia bacterium]|nr:membrane protein insertase YidC [Acidimicrobiia bacterium]
MFDWLFRGVGWLIAWIYSWSNDYSIAIGSMAIVVMLVITPLTLKSTRGMLEMQRLQPELRRLQIEHKGDRQGLNEAMMKLYQEHKVNPLASCLPLLAQMPVFIIMFRLLKGLTYRPSPGEGFAPKHLDTASDLYRSLVGQQEMRSIGLDLAVRPIDVVFRIGQQAYITKRFYGDDDSIGRQAQQASAKARELKDDDVKKTKKSENKGKNDDFSSKRVTPPKGKQQPQRRPTPPRGDGPPQRPKPPKR